MNRLGGLPIVRRRHKIYTLHGPLVSFRSSAKYVQAEVDARRQPTSPGFLSLQRLKNREATYREFTSPTYATPSEFLTLLTS
jgi:hypothetical protein